MIIDILNRSLQKANLLPWEIERYLAKTTTERKLKFIDNPFKVFTDNLLNKMKNYDDIMSLYRLENWSCVETSLSKKLAQESIDNFKIRFPNLNTMKDFSIFDFGKLKYLNENDYSQYGNACIQRLSFKYSKFIKIKEVINEWAVFKKLVYDEYFEKDAKEINYEIFETSHFFPRLKTLMEIMIVIQVNVVA